MYFSCFSSCITNTKEKHEKYVFFTIFNTDKRNAIYLLLRDFFLTIIKYFCCLYFDVLPSNKIVVYEVNVK